MAAEDIRGSARLDFQQVAEAALAMAHILLPEWIGGKRQGHEWVGERKANGGPGDSWSVNLNTGAWIHGAGDEKGGDMVSLYAALNHVDQLTALRVVAARCGADHHPGVPILARTRPAVVEYPAERIPDPAPPILPHFRHGEPVATYHYLPWFVVCRYDTPDGKVFAQFTWRNDKWANKGYPDARPLYCVHTLAQRPEAPVMIVEGEKCADAARAALKAYAVLTWASGSSSVRKTDWTPLTGRDVIIWPDADDAGAKAAASIAEILLPLARRVRVFTPTDKPDGWDVADAIADGWTATEIIQWGKENVRAVSAAPDMLPEPTPIVAVPLLTEPSPQDSVPAATEPDFYDNEPSAMVTWNSMRLDCAQGGIPHSTLANASLILQEHPGIRDHIWLDTFRNKIFTNKRFGRPSLCAPREWTDSDTANLTVFIQQSLHLPKFNSSLMNEAVVHASGVNGRNSLIDWLDSLAWDGTPRLDNWLADTLGVERTPYSTAVANNWPVSMIARAYLPGCQVDTMTVLEGKMGRGKSSFLAILGGEWFDAITTAFGEKDFLQSIQGLWLIEIPDMAGFGRREHSQILATVTMRNDRYRQSYGRYIENHARGCVFAATSETDDYLLDTRGRRRFWPLRCESIDLDALHAMREQIFAEAIIKYRAGSTWYEMPDETDDEQLQRADLDPWTEKVLEYADIQAANKMPISTAKVLFYAIEMPTANQDQGAKNRVAAILRRDNWIPTFKKGSRAWVKPKRD